MDTAPRRDGTDYAIEVGSAAGTSGGSSAAREESLALLPESTIGDVQVVRLIGCGKVSESWFGVDSSNQREVVVKVLRKPWSADARVLSYFQRQLTNVAELRHPNLANILSVGMDEGLLYWVTEWVKGGSVGPKIRRKGPMDISTALTSIDQAAAGLAHGHSAKLVHGGLKPENVLMERSGTVKISDLAIEFFARQLLTGTPAARALWVAEYMSPEVRSGGIPDLRSDIYSLGAILLYLVSGVVPQDGLLDASSPRITPALRELLIGMTAPKPEDRYADYEQLRAAIARAEAGTTGVRRAPTPANWRLDTRAEQALPTAAANTVILSNHDTQSDVLPASAAAVTPFDAELPSEAIAAAADLPPVNTAAAIPSADIAVPEPEPAIVTSDAMVSPAAERDTELQPALKLKTPPAGVASARPRNRKPLHAMVALLVVAAAAGGGYFYMYKRKGAEVTEQPVAVAAPTATPIVAPSAVVNAPVATPVPVAAAPAVQETPVQSILPVFPPVAGAAQQAPVTAQATAIAPSASSGATGLEILIDNETPAGLKLEPAGSWRKSSETRSSFQNGSLVGPVSAAAPLKATFIGNVPQTSRYQVYLYWVSRSSELRSTAVPVTVFTAAGPMKITVDQVNTEANWNLIGTFDLQAGQNQPLVSLSTEGVANESGTVHVSVDALKLVPLSN